MSGPWEKFQNRTPEYSGSILPMTRYSDGSVEFDSNAGILGPIKRAIDYSWDVYQGDTPPPIDLRTQQPNMESMDRAIEMGTTIGSSMVNPAVRSGARAIPGPKRAIKKVKPKPPTTEQLKNAGVKQLEEAKNLPVEYDPYTFMQAMDEVRVSLDQSGLTRRNAKKVHKILDEFNKPPEPDQILDFRGLRDLRAELQQIASRRDITGELTPQARAAVSAMGRLDKYVGNGGEGGFVVGPAAAVAELERAGRGNYAAAKRSHRLEDIITQARDKAGAANSGQNIGNNTRSMVERTVNSPRKAMGYSADEIDKMRFDIVRGKPGANTTRAASNLLGGGGGFGGAFVGTLGGLAGGTVGGTQGALTGAAATMAAGRGLRALSNRATKKQVEKLAAQTRMRSPLYEEMMRNAPTREMSPEMRQALLRALMMQQIEMQNRERLQMNQR
jgi:hypothetical protein